MNANSAEPGAQAMTDDTAGREQQIDGCVSQISKPDQRRWRGLDRSSVYGHYPLVLRTAGTGWLILSLWLQRARCISYIIPKTGDSFKTSAAGPKITIKMVGKMRKVIGNSILIGAF